MTDYYPAYAQAPVYVDAQGYPQYPAYQPGYAPSGALIWNDETQSYQMDAAGGPGMLVPEGSFPGHAEMSPYQQMALDGAPGFMGGSTASYLQGGIRANARAAASPYRAPDSPEPRKPPPSSWLTAVSKAYDAPTNNNMVMQRDPEPPEATNTQRNLPDAATTSPPDMTMHPPPPPYPAQEWSEPQMHASGPWQAPERPEVMYSEPYMPHMHMLPGHYHARPPPLYAEHSYMHQPHGFCERCAQRDYDRYHDLMASRELPPQRVRRESTSSIAPAAEKSSAGGRTAVAEELESPRKGKPDAETIWDGTTWDAFPFLLMCCAPVCCVVKHWHITEDRIDLVHSCCGTKEDTIYVRKIKDVSLGGDCCTATFCCGRNTVIVTAADQTHPELRLTTWGARRIFHRLRDAKDERHGIMLEDND